MTKFTAMGSLVAGSIVRTPRSQDLFGPPARWLPHPKLTLVDV